MLTRSILYLLFLTTVAVPSAGLSDAPTPFGAGNGIEELEEQLEADSAPERAARTSSPASLEYASGTAPADRILSTIGDAALRSLVADVLERNPEVAAAVARAEAAEQRAPQARALPDPVAGLTAFLLTPETRVGPQEASARIAQKFPWFGKLKLRERAELYAAAAARAEVEALRLRLLTETRRLYYELGFVDAFEEVVLADRATLSHYEELAEARYRSGIGLQQVVIKIQAEITKANSRLLEIADRRASIVAFLNALRDYPQGTQITEAELPDLPEIATDLETLHAKALDARPEIVTSDARIARSTTHRRSSRARDYKPGLQRSGLTYTLVGSARGSRPAGSMLPPEGNGDDIFGISRRNHDLPTLAQEAGGGSRGSGRAPNWLR